MNENEKTQMKMQITGLEYLICKVNKKIETINHNNE